MSKLSSLLYAVLLTLPLMAAAQTSVPPGSPPPAGATPPVATETPISVLSGTSTDPTGPSLPRVDSSGVNQSVDNSVTGAALAPAGAPRLSGTPMTPPTGPID